jgi:hypothetical protein
LDSVARTVNRKKGRAKEVPVAKKESKMPADDYETLARRKMVIDTLQTWDYLAIHSISSSMSVPKVRERLIKELIKSTAGKKT